MKNLKERLKKNTLTWVYILSVVFVISSILANWFDWAMSILVGVCVVGTVFALYWTFHALKNFFEDLDI
jgi:uncharacterized membrane protein